MPDKHRGYVEIELGGESYEIRLGMNEMANLDDALGASFLTVLGEGQAGARVIRQAIFEGLAQYRLKNRREKLTPRKVGAMMDPAKLEYYLDKLIEALEAGGWLSPETDDEAEEGMSDPEAEEETAEGGSISETESDF